MTDLTSNSDCMSIASNDVVFDGNGHVIVGGLSGATGVNINGSNVTVRNLELEWDTSYGVVVQEGLTDILIKNNTVRGNLLLGDVDGATTGVRVTENRIENTTADGDVNGGTLAIGLRQSEITDNRLVEASIFVASGVNSSSVTHQSRNVTVARNDLDSPLSAGVMLSLVDNSTIAHNTITNSLDSGVTGAGVHLGIGLHGVRNIAVTDNEVARSNDGISEGAAFLDVDRPSSSVTVRSNRLHNNTNGINISSMNASVLEVHRNVIEDNTKFGVRNRNSSVLDATRNYWGASDGPSGNVTDPVTGTVADGSGDAVSTNVHFDPWLNETPSDAEYLTSSGDVGAPGELVTLDFNLTNVGDARAGFIVNITTPIPDAYSRDDAGGTWRPSTQEWVFLNVSSGESRTPSYTVRAPSDASLGNFTVRSEASSSATRTVVDDATATVRVVSSSSLLDEIDSNPEDCQIQSNELLRAIDLWQTDSEVPNTGGQTISTSLLLDVTNSWSADATLTYSPDCTA